MAATLDDRSRNRFRHGLSNKVFAIIALSILVILLMAGILIAKSNASPASARVTNETDTVYRWGSYLSNKGNKADKQSTPTPVPNLSGVVAVDASNSNSFALQCMGGSSDCSTDGKVWAWGNGGNGQLGDGSTRNSIDKPVEVKFPTGVYIVSIGEAEDSGYAIDSTGQGWGWGLNGSGSLCIGNDTEQDVPVQIPGITSATQVQGGEMHVLWLLSDGSVESCGINDYGQLGDSTYTASATPVPVTGLTNIVQISAGNLTSAARDRSGNIYMWGDNAEGQLGINSDVGSTDTPTQVTLPDPAIEVSAGGDLKTNGHSMALLDNNQVYAWGDNSSGQLGDGTTVTEDAPVKVRIPKGVTYSYICAGGQSSMALDTEGNVWTWGDNGGGQLGDPGKSGYSTTALRVDSGVDLISTTANNVLDHHS